MTNEKIEQQELFEEQQGNNQEEAAQEQPKKQTPKRKTKAQIEEELQTLKAEHELVLTQQQLHKERIDKQFNEKSVGQFSNKELETLRQTIAQGTTNEQFGLFVQTCNRTGLNPFLNHIYPIVYKETMSLQISVEGILSIARRNKDYISSEAQTVHENDKFRMAMDEHGTLKVTQHEIVLPRGKVLGAYAVAKKEGVPNLTTLVESTEVEHLKNSNISNTRRMWNNYYNDMIKKHALKRAIKAQFGVEIGDFEEQEEVTNFDNFNIGKKEITRIVEEQEKVQVSENQSISKEQLMKQEIEKAHTVAKQKNIDIEEYCQNKFGATISELSPQKLAALNKFLSMESEKENVIEAESVDVVEEEQETKEESNGLDSYKSLFSM